MYPSSLLEAFMSVKTNIYQRIRITTRDKAISCNMQSYDRARAYCFLFLLDGFETSPLLNWCIISFIFLVSLLFDASFQITRSLLGNKCEELKAVYLILLVFVLIVQKLFFFTPFKLIYSKLLTIYVY